MLCDRCGAGSILVSSWVTCLRGSTLTTVNTHPTRTQNETKQIPGIISSTGIATKINKENAIDDKQLRNTGLSNNYTAYGAGKRQLHTETPWEKS
ncbi:hypothetical protein ACLKA7_012194 [Drosophila subpalustris]